MMRSHIAAGLGAVLLAGAAAVPAPAVAADKVTLMLNWYVYGEHAPFYYGKEKGIYAKQGIDLDIQEGRGSAVTTQAVAAKTATFRSEEHTSELQSLMRISYAVFCLKKKKR